MKIIKILVLFLYFNYLPSFAQSIKINIYNTAVEGIEKGALMISDSEGNVLYETIFSKTDLQEDITLEYSKESLDEQYNITFFWKQTIGDHYIKAKTFYNIKEDLLINEPLFFDYRLPKHKDLRIKINEIQELHGILMYSGTKDNYTNVRPKPKKEFLKIGYEHPLNADLYFVLHGNNEGNFRYIYTPKDEIQSSTEITWSKLPMDLEEYSIDLHESQKWNGFIRATNELTGNKCYFYEANGEEDLQKVQFYIPKSFFFYDYEMFFYREKEDYSLRHFQYYSKEDYFTPVPKTIEEDFNYEIQYMDEYGFDIMFEQIQNEINFISIDGWQVIAKNEEHVNFKFPTLSGSLANAFPSLQEVDKKKLQVILIKQLREGESEVRVQDDFIWQKEQIERY